MGYFYCNGRFKGPVSDLEMNIKVRLCNVFEELRDVGARGNPYSEDLQVPFLRFSSILRKMHIDAANEIGIKNIITRGVALSCKISLERNNFFEIVILKPLPHPLPALILCAYI